MRWLLNVTDAGPSPLRFVALAHHSDAPGCEHTIENPRSRVDISGLTNYGSRSAGQTTFSFDPRHYSCGRVQVDVSIFQADGRETLIVGMVVNYGSVCAPPPPPPPATPLKCTPGNQTVNLNQVANLAATGGTGTYEWSSVGAPARGAGATFATAFASGGTYSVVVTSGNATATCVVEVPTPPVVRELTCTPATRTVGVNEIAELSAAGGNGSYAWSGGGAPAAGSAATFQTAFAAAGTHPVTVTSGGLSATCQVTVTSAPPPPPPPPALVCSPEAQSATINQPVMLTAQGGTGSYAWSGGGSPASGSGASFSTAFASAGTHTVTVTSGSATARCNVEVKPPVTELLCGPDAQTAKINQRVTVNASGGDGVYSWTIDIEGGSPSTGTGPSFTTQFGAEGVYNIYAHSAGQRSKCRVVVR